jgi:peroxiredoxin Q/BCP
VLEQYGAWGKKMMYGREYMGVIRKTYLIDKDGIIVKIFPKVNVNGHSKEILSCFGIR